MAWFMLGHIGLPRSALKGDLDGLYVERLLELVRTSSLGRVVILAHEQVYDVHGRLMERFGSVYVPNDYVLKLAREHPVLLPAVSIHPAQVDALEELNRCIAAGAVRMKCPPNFARTSVAATKESFKRVADLTRPSIIQKNRAK